MARELTMPSFDLSGKTAVVTGGTKGLGMGIAATLAYYGANVVITARTAKDVESVTCELMEKYVRGGNRIIGVPADSVKQTDIDKVVEKCVESFGELNILINNAGIYGKTARILSNDCDEANFQKVIDTNLKGVFLFAKAAAKQMKAQGKGGKIINISSVGALVGGAGVAAYGASKAGVISLTKTFAYELAADGVTVVAVCPGGVVTPLNEDMYLNADGSHTQIYDLSAKKAALRRLGAIEEIAGPVCALCSDCFSYMTGTFIVIDGGQTIGE